MKKGIKFWITVICVIALISSFSGNSNKKTDVNTKNTQDNKQLVKNSNKNNNSQIDNKQTNTSITNLEVDACDLSSVRKPNKIVDVGYGDRQYFAYTNEYSQLVRVSANNLTLQNEVNGRYCNDEAKVEGVENTNLDEGHAIADSLGGVSNAYNITPENSYQNRSGQQAKFEKEIRNALENSKHVSNFIYTITYPNTKTQVPSSYDVKYKIDGNEQHYYFKNTNAPKNNQEKEKNLNNNETINSSSQNNNARNNETINSSNQNNNASNNETINSSNQNNNASNNETINSSNQNNNASNNETINSSSQDNSISNANTTSAHWGSDHKHCYMSGHRGAVPNSYCS